MSHTPGPWTFSQAHGNRYIKSADGKLSICDMDYYPWVDATDDDWRLIAAAPELLEALKSLADFSEPFISIVGEPEQLVQARAVIAKAEGGAK